MKRILLALLVILIPIVGLLTYKLALQPSRLEIEVQEAANEINIDCGKEVTLPDAKAYYYSGISNKTDVEVKVENNVDASKPGKYLVKYIAEYGKDKVEKDIVVNILDKEAPVITLVTDPIQYTSPVGEYEEQGFTATDNVDGDISDKVERVVTHDKVVYSVKDSSGNETTVEREIIYKDVIAPKVTLNGSKSMTIKVDGKYKEEGATAKDEVDGTLTDKIEVSGKVNTKKRGIYDITYTVKDSSGNVGKAVRTVKVISPQPNNPVVYPGGKVIYLTFDDGPGQYTKKLLDVLDKYNVKATFFVCNHPSYNYLIGEEAKRGHTVAIHSFTHDYKTIYSSEKAFIKDIEKMNDVIEKQTGARANILRFPGGSSNTVSKNYCRGVMTQLTGTVAEMGYTYFDWNVLSGDAGQTTNTQTVISNIKKGCSRIQYL